MSIADRWLLPDGVEEVLPPHAARLEAIRRRLLDGFASWGYELVITPLIEYLESLLTGTGEDLDLKTFKVTDQVSGRMMGIRADITPQVARIDAHSLGREGIVRLCYAGTVLHAKADNQLASRTPISVGAELFGDTGARGDLEIVSLMIEVLGREGIAPIHVELGDVGIFRELMKAAGIADDDEQKLFELTQRKAVAEIETALESLAIKGAIGRKIAQLPTFCGDASVLDDARKLFAEDRNIVKRIASLEDVASGLRERFDGLDIYYDLSELRGYAYHTGIVFAAYVGGSGQRLAKGGRYDHVGEVFGRARAATGFDIDLKALATNSSYEARGNGVRVYAPIDVIDDAAGRWQLITSLRSDGYIVIESNEVDDSDPHIAVVDGEWKFIEAGTG